MIGEGRPSCCKACKETVNDEVPNIGSMSRATLQAFRQMITAVSKPDMWNGRADKGRKIRRVSCSTPGLVKGIITRNIARKPEMAANLFRTRTQGVRLKKTAEMEINSAARQVPRASRETTTKQNAKRVVIFNRGSHA